MSLLFFLLPSSFFTQKNKRKQIIGGGCCCCLLLFLGKKYSFKKKQERINLKIYEKVFLQLKNFLNNNNSEEHAFELVTGKKERRMKKKIWSKTVEYKRLLRLFFQKNDGRKKCVLKKSWLLLLFKNIFWSFRNGLVASNFCSKIRRKICCLL